VTGIRTAHASPVGIDDVNVYGSTLAIDHALIGAARGHSDRNLQLVDFKRRSVTPPYEDAVTLAVTAAHPLVESAGRDAFELLIVATESGLDFGKPLSAYVHRHLGLATRCRNVEMKHACYGGTAAVQLAVAWARAADAPGKKALVVMTDLARRHIGDPGELTAGSGAVALTISAEPAVLEIEPRGGYASREIYDVARPTATLEHADPVLSLAAYLDLIEEAWANYRSAVSTTAPLDERFQYVLYHTPLVSLVREAHRLLLEIDGVQRSPEQLHASFERMVGPALRHARELSNIYSGSVYALLAGLLDGDAALAPQTRIGICSYGSGSCAEIYGGVVAESARERIRRHGIASHLADRARLDVAEYERLVAETEAMLVASDYEPPRDFIPGHFERGYAHHERLVLRRVENHRREYAWSTDVC
jgi:3-hydroxy-3-methylglutaryl CoA synthase